jgi:hypothetical protein
LEHLSKRAIFLSTLTAGPLCQAHSGARSVGLLFPQYTSVARPLVFVYNYKEFAIAHAVFTRFEGKPIAASVNVYEDERFEDIVRVWNDFVFWHKFVMRKLPENERIFSTKIEHRFVWVMDYKVFFMMMYPEDY